MRLSPKGKLVSFLIKSNSTPHKIPLYIKEAAKSFLKHNGAENQAKIQLHKEINLDANV